jgi:conjugative transposon TraM protein
MGSQGWRGGVEGSAVGWRSPGWRGGVEEPSMGSPALHSPDVERLERLMKVMKESGSAGSPEMQELNKTLDKLMAVQQPSKLRDGSAADGGRGDSLVAAPVLPVHTVVAGEVVSGSKPSGPGGNRFYDLESSSGEEEPTGTAIEAIVPETQVLVNGAMMRLELATELVIRGQRVAKGTALYGTVRLSNERLMVTIGSIRYRDQVYPVALQVRDQDGLAGIYSPGSINRDVARESAGESIGSAGPAGLDASLGGQAANAGIQLARSLASRKVRLIRVTVKAGYRVFLQDERQSH